MYFIDTFWRQFNLLLVGGGLLGAAGPAVAQPSRPATHVDSVRAARDGQPTYFPALITFVSGKQVHGYLDSYTTCQLDRVECYEVPPDRLPRPTAKAISIERLKSISVDGHLLEALYQNGKPLKMLAENLAAPGPLQIFGYAKTKNNIPIPIPLGPTPILISTGTHEKYYWYVRSVGGELQEVPRDQKGFVKLMSQICAQAPTLVADLQRPPTGPSKADRQPRYRVDNAPELINRHNALLVGH